MKKYYPVIGMEVHVELKTKSKMFCGCPAEHFQVRANTHTCPVCLGLPGALPVANKKAIDWTAIIGLALDCQVQKQSKFDRKHYFYPDLPKGYQISQYDQPLCRNGFLKLESGKKIRVNRVHIEEDTGKLIHKKVNGKKVSLIDFNRSGVPLVEIVTEPDITSGSEAKEYLKKLRTIIRSLNVSDCDMEKGSMRLEANISLTTQKNQLPDYKVEIKNLNSFRFVARAIDYEITRQKRVLESGKKPSQETRGYNDKTRETFLQRTKEGAEDYRYFPEPDIPPMIFTDQQIKNWQTQLPELPSAKIDKLVNQYKISKRTAQILVTNPNLASYSLAVIDLAQKQKTGLKPIMLANLIVNKKVNINKTKPEQLISQLQKQARTQIEDISSLKPIINQVVIEEKEAVGKFQQGKTSVLSFLIGRVMSKTKGQAKPDVVKKLLLANLSSKK